MQLIAITAIPAVVALSAATIQDSTVVLTGAKFLQACAGIEPGWIDFCHGYVQAVLDGIGKPWNEICAPAGLTTAEVVDIVIKGVRETPSSQDLNAASLVYDSLLKAYPCR